MNLIQVTIDPDKNVISVLNNGQGIPVEVHAEHGVYIPEMIFGELLTSSNYDDSKKKVTGGRNGYGAKLTNIFSTEFIVETSHKKTKRRFKQVFRDNMHKKEAPIINDAKENDYTKITFKPDLEKFKMTHLDEDIVALMTKRVYDVAGCNTGIKVSLNGTRLPVNSFKSYVQLYLPEDNKLLYEKVSDRWEVAVATTDGEYQQVSFVNSICTVRGGTHVEHVAKQVVKIVQEAITKKNKGGAEIKPSHVKNHLWVFVKSLIENPAFDSQTKETLTTKVSDFGSKCTLTEDFLKKVAKSDLVNKVLQWTKFRESITVVGKGSGKKKGKLNIAKLDDANNAGGKHAQDCTLIIVEGDSAKTQAVSGLGVVGRDNFGAFPLRGKMVNVRDAQYQTISKNAEISHLVQILGLKLGHTYEDTSSLRYGHVMIMTDQDYDGSHIKGLLINFIHFFWPSLLKLPGFLTEFITPIVRISKSKKSEYFYTMPEFKAWVEQHGTKHGWDVKYLKGLGSSTSTEFKQFFSEIDNHRVDFAWTADADGEAIDMAFSKKRADERKRWLGEFKPGTFLEQHTEEITYSDFVNKELVLFSIADCERSIPSLVDGLKPSQRKVLHAMFKRNVKKETKVIQIAGYVMEMCAYHHGETSLYSTTIGLAQDFVGSNNINLLYPGGSFGSRIQGGADASSPRYINTKLAEIARYIFRQEDEPLLDYLVDDGKKIEPKWFVPIIPMVLVNGAQGIGTGWSTHVPCHNPRDIVANIRRLLEGEPQQPMHPWYAGFKGKIAFDPEKKRYNVSGIWKRIDARTIEITELPIMVWTQDYKEHLLGMINPDPAKKQPPFLLKDMKEYHTDTSVHFIVESEEDFPADDVIEKVLKLTGYVNVTNMTMFDSEGRIRQWESATAILDEFYTLRLQFYDKRKEHLVDALREDWKRLDNKVRFILAVVNKEIIINNRKKADLLKELRDKNFDPFPTKSAKAKTKVAGNDVAIESDDEAEQGEGEQEEDTKDKKASTADKSSKDYDYLLSMPLWNLTLEKVQELVRQRDDKSEELKVLLGTSAKQLWIHDLDELSAAMDARDAQYAEDNDKQKSLKKKGGGKLKARKVTRRPAKSKKDSDDDDDFAVSKSKPKAAPSKPAPSKPAPSKPAPSKLVPAKPAAAANGVKSGDEKKTGSKKTLQSYFSPVADKEEDEENLTLAQRLAKKGKQSPFKNSKKAGSDAEDSDAPVSRKRKSPAKKSKKTDDDSEEEKVTKKKPAKKAKIDSDDDEEPVKKKAPAKKAKIDSDDDEEPVKKKAPAKKKATVIVEDDESDAPKPKKKLLAKKDKHSSDEDDSDAPVIVGSRPSRSARPKVDYSKMLKDDSESDVSLFSD
eukprot:Phypoly_transcript_00381.p1 GENE.Phypoly_transcript_00381~~Phypoly_transcript_00381.p1  ORF type:complete len:1577 (+),score=426.38 Phypoly_transcript_00381:657-4733(+)